MNKMEKWNMDIGTKLTYVVRCFRMWKEVDSLYKYKAQGFWKTFVVVHHHVCKDLLSQKNVVIVNPNVSTFFFLDYWMWFASKPLTIDFSININFLFSTNQGCAKSTWVFMGITTFVLLYLMKVLQKTKV